jgi:hypothetical protein
MNTHLPKMLKRLSQIALLALCWFLPSQLASAETAYKRIPTQYIAALGDKMLNSGTGAEHWGLWAIDPGPRGVKLRDYETLVGVEGSVAPAGWKFDGGEWWLEEHGLLMENPVFPIPAGKYVVSGAREVTAVLTIHPKGADGTQKWELDQGASLYDVTHLRCRAARYTPESANSCSPAKAQVASIPVPPGEAMPAVAGCKAEDFQVLIVIGMVEGS